MRRKMQTICGDARPRCASNYGDGCDCKPSFTWVETDDKPRVYLAGPINGCTDSEAKDWRGGVKARYADEFDFLDPMMRDYRGRELEPGIREKIVEGDKEDIRRSDALLVRFLKPSVGTDQEEIYAWERDKVVVVWTDEGISLSPWLTYHCHAVVTSEGEAVAAIRRLLGVDGPRLDS